MAVDISWFGDVSPLRAPESLIPCGRYDGSIYLSGHPRKTNVTLCQDTYAKKLIFQHNNDPKHQSKLIEEYCSKKKIDILKWPSQSPDLNPIEHLWEELDRRIRTQNYSNQDDLFCALKKEWAKIPQNSIIKLIESMPRRCKAVLSAKGYATKY
jgi:hypothetical protein